MKHRKSLRRLLIWISCLALLIVELCSCHPSDESSFSFNAEQYTYNGTELTALQLENLEADMANIVGLITLAVHDSRPEIDLSAYADKEQWILSSMQMASTMDPLVELVEFQADHDKKGCYHIEYGCEEKQHRELVKAFRYKVESARRYNRMSVYQVLMNGTGVCQQFSRAYSFLLRQAGIPVLEIGAISNVPFRSNNVMYNGKTEGELFGITHMWNEVQLSGKWYGVDITYAVNCMEAELPPDSIFQFFGMSDKSLQNHFPSDTDIVTPGCQSMSVPLCEEELALLEKQSLERQSTKIEDALAQDVPAGLSYQQTIDLPEGYCEEQSYPVCYLLGDGMAKETAELTEDTIYVRITASTKEDELFFSQNPETFLSLFMDEILENVESKYSVDPDRRTLCGSGLGADLCLYTLFQSDGLTKDAFARYVCADPDMYSSIGGKELSTYDELYFDRCKSLPVCLKIHNSHPEEAGQSAICGVKASPHTLHF